MLVAEPNTRRAIFNTLHTALPHAQLIRADKVHAAGGGIKLDHFGDSDCGSSKIGASRHRPFDIAFVDTAFAHGHGVNFVHDLQQLSGNANVVLVGDTPEQLAGGFSLHCSGYVVAPLTRNIVYHELSNMRYPLQRKPSMPQSAPQTPHVYVRCFGAFEVFCDGVPLHTKRQKSKELLACLVCQRGALFSVGDVEAVLWELSPYTSSNQSYLRHLVADLQKSLQACGADNMLVRRRGFLGVNTNAFECDYYDYLDKKPDASPFTGRFMSQYSWAEPLAAALASSH